MKALIVKKQWLDLILSGKKIWEVRGTNTKVRGKILLIQSGTKTVVGECQIVDSIKLNSQLISQNIIKHQIQNTSNIAYATPHAWVIKNAVRYKVPAPYNHPKGAIIWVNINK